MSKTFRRIGRAAFADRLGLHCKDLSPKPNSAVLDTSTVFLNAQGETLGTHARAMCPITGNYDEEFSILMDTAEADEVHSSLWL